MKKIFPLLLILCAMWVEWILELVSAPFMSVSLPLTAIMLFYEYWEIKLPQRLFYGILIGGVSDVLSPFPFGTITGVFFGIAFLMELFRFVFSNVTSSLTKGIGMGLSLFFYHLSILPFATILGITQQHMVLWNNTLFQHAIVGGLLWGIVGPFVLLTPLYIWKKYVVFRR